MITWRIRYITKKFVFPKVTVLIFLQGADKTVKGPDGLTAFEATENQAIKALLQ